LYLGHFDDGEIAVTVIPKTNHILIDLESPARHGLDSHADISDPVCEPASLSDRAKIRNPGRANDHAVATIPPVYAVHWWTSLC
jgi:hypothetical protein